jgi:hypothetical protein
MSDSGNSFELLILRYEYPDITEDRWDSNWLVVSGKVTTPDSDWRFIEPCVTTFELADLADWLDALGSDGEEPAAFAFTEPNLAVSYSAVPAPVLRICFAHESAPPWLEGAEARAAGLTLDFSLPGTLARDAADQLRQALVEYPIRGGAA